MGYIGFNSYDIWMDGFSSNGNRQEPQLIIEDVIGEDFESACFVALSGRDEYNVAANSIWGCKLHQSKEDCFDPTSKKEIGK